MDDPELQQTAVRTHRTYEEYLDSLVSPKDHYYLENEEVARAIVELGYRGTGETLTRAKFQATQDAASLRLASGKTRTGRTLASDGLALDDPLLVALADREEGNRTGTLSTIILLRSHNARGHEVSAYIDYQHRLVTEDFRPYFEGKKRLLPQHTDLSFYNWQTQQTFYTPTPNYQVLSDSGTCLLFRNKHDRKEINVDPTVSTPGDDTTRTVIRLSSSEHIVLYDHRTRRKV